jgi:UDP-glucose 4-epimerase
MKRIVVTGANGFLGSSFVGNLARTGYEVFGIVRGHSDTYPSNFRTSSYRADSFAKLLKDLRPEIVVQAAGAASVAASFDDPLGDYQSSVNLVYELFDGIRQSGLKPKVLLLSSAAVYGNPQKLPIPELSPLEPISPYGYHKLGIELVAREFSSIYGIPCVAARIFSTFGVEQKRLLIWDIYHKLMTMDRIILAGTGDETRDYLHGDDVVRYSMLLLNKLNAGFCPANMASGSAVCVRDIAAAIQAILKTNKLIEFSGQGRPGDPRFWQADTTKLSELTGTEPDKSFLTRLSETVKEWQCRGY